MWCITHISLFILLLLFTAWTHVLYCNKWNVKNKQKNLLWSQPSTKCSFHPFYFYWYVFKHTHLHASKWAAHWVGGQLFKLLFRSVSSSGPGCRELCNTVRPDIMTSLVLVLASLVGIGPNPRAQWPKHQLDLWLKSCATFRGFLENLPCVTVIWYSADINNVKLAQLKFKLQWITGNVFSATLLIYIDILF